MQPEQTETTSQAIAFTSEKEKLHATAVASDGNLVLWAWPELNGQFTQVRLQFRDVNGNAVTSSGLLTNSASNKKDLTVASGAGGKFLVAWEQLDSTGISIKGTVVQNIGGQLGVTTGIFTVAPSGSLSHPRAVYDVNRAKFLVVFTNRAPRVGLGQTEGRFLTSSGVLDPAVFVIASVPGARLTAPDINRLTDPEVVFAPTTGVLLVTMEASGSGPERIFAATIPATNNTAQIPMIVDTMDGAAPVFNKRTNKFVVPMIDDLSNGGITLATLAAGCQTDVPSSCQITRSPVNVVKPAANRFFMNIAAAPLGSGVMVTTAQTSQTSSSVAEDHFFFDSGMKLIRTTSLLTSSTRVFGTNSTAELSPTRTVSSHTLIDAGGDLHEFFIAAPPSDYVVQNSF